MAPSDDAAERNSSTILARFIMYINSIISPTAAASELKADYNTHYDGKKYLRFGFITTTTITTTSTTHGGRVPGSACITTFGLFI